MKEVAILLVVALLLNGCGTNSSPAQTAVGGLWSATMLGGVGPATGFSFSTQFTVSGSGGALAFSSFQFYTAGDCLAVNGETPAGAMALTVNQNTYQVTGTFTFTVESGGNTLALTGTVTGTENGLTGTKLSGGVITGTWTFTGSGTPTGCNDTSGSFTMTQVS